jgi:hypothetical protein
MAGAEAEREIVGLESRGDDDRYQIALMMDSELASPDSPEGVRIEARLRKMARMLVRRHRERIERVAMALCEHKTLSSPQLDQLIGRSVNDVRVNAPFLLAQHREEAKRRRRNERRRALRAERRAHQSIGADSSI